MNNIRGQIQIGRPPIDVLNFVTQFDTWPRWYPITKRVTGDVDHPCEPGEKCTEYVTIFMVPFRFYWKVISKEVPKEKHLPLKFVFKGTSNVGGEATISYTFTPKDGGTLFERRLDYCQTRLLMKFADWLCIGRYVAYVSGKAIRNAKALLEAKEDGGA